MIYTLITMTALCSLLGLAVDLARTQTVKTELRRVADAAARAAVANLSTSTTAAQNAAVHIAAQNTVDGATITLSTTNDIQIGNWNTSTSTFTSGATPYNAVRIYARRTTANGNPLSLLFGSLIGVNTVDVWAVSTAALVLQHSMTGTVNGTSNIWLAGEPAGTSASVPDSEYANAQHEWKYDLAGTYGGTDSSKNWSTDYATGEPYASPLQVNFTVNPGDVITLTGVSGTVLKGPGDDEGEANGVDKTSGGTIGMDDDEAADGVSEHGMSDIDVPGDSMVGVFLNSSTPDGGTAPTPLDFSTQTERDYTSVSPQLQQTFYAGTGTTSSAAGSAQQYINVPSGATRMFLGSMDGHENSNNSGSYSVTITDYQVVTVQ